MATSFELAGFGVTRLRRKMPWIDASKVCHIEVDLAIVVIVAQAAPMLHLG